MKFLFSFLMLCFSIFYKGQHHIVINEKLQFQLAKNQVARSASNNIFLNSFKKQRTLYDSINKKMIQVVAVQEYIYDKLYKVNTSITNGKKLKYIYKDLGYLSNKSVDLVKLTAKYPQYAGLLYEQYAVIGNEAIKLKEELQEIFVENRKNLKDPYDVSVMLERVHLRINVLIEHTARTQRRLETAHRNTYWKSIPVLSHYVNTDRAIIRNIMERSTSIFKK